MMAMADKQLVKQGEEFVECPINGYEGGIVVYRNPTAQLVMDWWETMQKMDEERDKKPDYRHPYARLYEQRKMFIKEWKVRGITDAMTLEDGRHFPDWRFVPWVNQVVGDIVVKTQDPFGKLDKLLPPVAESTA